MREMSLDANLTSSRAADVIAMARFFGGKNTRKDDAIAYIKAALEDPEQVRTMLMRVAPNERLALQLFKHFDGIASTGGLAVAVCTLGTSVPKVSSYYHDDPSHTFQLINQHHLFTQAQSDRYYRPSRQDDWGAHYGIMLVYTDARILAQVDPPQFEPFDIAPLADGPSSGLARRPQSITFQVLGMLNALQKMNGLHLNKSQARVIRPADLAKLTTALKWDEHSELDGRPFPHPVDAFVGALAGADLLTRQNDVLLPSETAAQFATLPYAEQVKKLVLSFVHNQAWQEYDYQTDNLTRSLRGNQLTAGRMGLLAVLMALPRDERGFFSLSDIEQAWFRRVGEVFSMAYRPSPPSTYNRTPAQIKSDQQQWRKSIRDVWLKADCPWMARALSTWAYQLGLVELCIIQGLMTAIRLTDLGREVLHGQSAASPLSASGTPQPTGAEQSTWVIQPNFEIVAYLDHLAAPQLAFLDRHAERISSQQHTAHYRLTRDSVYRGLESGTAVDDLLTSLQAGARNPLPQNITVELRSWAELRERIMLRRDGRLVEYASHQRRDDALGDGLPGTAIGDRFVLLQPDTASEPRTDRHVDYNQPPSKCLSISETGKIRLQQAGADLLITAQLTQWAERVAPDQWQLTQASVSAALKTGAGISGLYALLESRCALQLPPFLKLALRHWASSKRTALASISTVTILRCDDLKTFEAILGSKQLKPHLRGQLGEDAVLVETSAVEAVQRILEWAGLAEGVAFE